MAKFDQDAPCVKCVAALQNKASLVKLNVVAANGTAAETQRSGSRSSSSVNFCKGMTETIRIITYTITYTFF
jgi:hypothetical protein